MLTVHTSAIILSVQLEFLTQPAAFLEAIPFFKVDGIELDCINPGGLVPRSVYDPGILMRADRESGGKIVEISPPSQLCRSSQTNPEADGTMRPALGVATTAFHSP
jgi:hypothetical protein